MRATDPRLPKCVVPVHYDVELSLGRAFAAAAETLGDVSGAVRGRDAALLTRRAPVAAIAGV